MKSLKPQTSPSNLNSNISLKQQESHYLKHRLTKLIAKKRYTQAIEILIDEIKYGGKPTSLDGEESYTERKLLFYYPQLAYCYLKTNNFYKCRQTLNSLLEERPNDSTALFLLAYLDLLDDDIEKAIYRYTQLLKIPSAQKKARKILDYFKKSNNSIEILLKKYLNFFYQHPSQLKPPSIFNFKQWLDFKRTLKPKSTKEISEKNNQDNNPTIQQSNNPNKRNIRKYILLFTLIPTLFLISFLLIKSNSFNALAESLREIQNLKAIFTTLQEKLFGENNTNTDLEKTNLSPSIQQEIRNQTTWGIAYQTMETAIKNKDMNLAILTYNRVVFNPNPQLNLRPESLKKDFDILYYFIVPPSYKSLKNTSLKKLTEIIKRPSLYKEVFLKLKGTLKGPHKKKLDSSNYSYTHIPVKDTPLYKRVKNTPLSIQITFEKKPIIKRNQTVEILARFKEIKKPSNKLQSIILTGVSIKSLIKKPAK